MNADKARSIRTKMLLALDYDQDDTPLTKRVKNAVRATTDEQIAEAVEATRETRDFLEAVILAAVAGGATREDAVLAVRSI